MSKKELASGKAAAGLHHHAYCHHHMVVMTQECGAGASVSLEESASGEQGQGAAALVYNKHLCHYNSETQLQPKASVQVLLCPEKSRPQENKDKVLLGYTAMVDAWAMGILAYELIVGRPPFEKQSRAATYEHIIYRKPEFAATMRPDAKDFVFSALTKVTCFHQNNCQFLEPWQLYTVSIKADLNSPKDFAMLMHDIQCLCMHLVMSLIFTSMHVIEQHLPC